MSKNQEIIERLCQLDGEEAKDFIDFIESPFFKLNKKSADLVRLLQRGVLAQDEKNGISILAKKLKRSEGTILNQLTLLSKAYRDFRIHRTIRDNSLEKNLFYLRHLDVNDSFEYLSAELNNYESWYLENKTSLSQRQKHETKKQLLYFKERVSRGLFNEGDIKNVYGLIECDIELFLLDYFYFQGELRSRRGMDRNKELTKHLIEFSKVNQKKDEFHLSRLFVLLYTLQCENTDVAFKELNTFCRTNLKFIEKINRAKVTTGLINHCLYKINLGDHEMQGDLFQLYYFADQKKFLHEIMHTTNFKNAVKAGLSQDELAWTISFIRQYQDYILPVDKEVTVSYSLASVDFHKKAYTSCSNRLNDSYATTTIQKLQFSILKLRCLYHLEDVDALFAEGKRLIALSKKLEIKKMKAVAVFKKMTLSAFKHKFNTKQKQKLKDELEKSEAIEKQWLFEILK